SLVISNIETAFLPSNTASSFFVCADAALILGILELVFADVLPKLFGQIGPGQRVFADHCGQCGVGLHGFAKGVFGGGGGFLRGLHRAIRTRRAWEPSEKSTLFLVLQCFCEAVFYSLLFWLVTSRPQFGRIVDIQTEFF